MRRSWTTCRRSSIAFGAVPSAKRASSATSVRARSTASVSAKEAGRRSSGRGSWYETRADFGSGIFVCTLVQQRASAVEPSAAVLGGFAVVDAPWAFGARGGALLFERAYAGGTFLYHPKGLWPESTTS